MSYTPSIIYVRISKDEGYLVAFPNRSGLIYQMLSIDKTLLIDTYDLTPEILETQYKVKPVLQLFVSDKGTISIVPLAKSIEPSLPEKGFKMFSKYKIIVLASFASTEAIVALRKRELLLKGCDRQTSEKVAKESVANNLKNSLKDFAESLELTFDQERQLKDGIENQKRLALVASEKTVTAKAK